MDPSSEVSQFSATHSLSLTSHPNSTVLSSIQPMTGARRRWLPTWMFFVRDQYLQIFQIILISSDAPSVTIERHTSSVLEDGRGSITLTCMSQSNPPGRIMWYKKGDSGTPQFKEQLVFDPISKQQAGDYVCAAENSVGRSREAVTTVEVLCK